jgi:hypothetical protein
MAASQAGLASSVVAGFVGLVVGIFIGVAAAPPRGSQDCPGSSPPLRNQAPRLAYARWPRWSHLRSDEYANGGCCVDVWRREMQSGHLAFASVRPPRRNGDGLEPIPGRQPAMCGQRPLGRSGRRVERLRCLRADADDARLPPLPENSERPCLGVNGVLDAESRQLGQTQAGVEQGVDDRVFAAILERVSRACREQNANLFFRKDRNLDRGKQWGFLPHLRLGDSPSA